MLVSMELGQGCHNCPEYPEKPNFFLKSISILLFGHFLLISFKNMLKV